MCSKIKFYFSQREKGVLGRIHKAYIPIAHTSSPTNLALLILYLGNVNI
jgi:hypothetical protein